MPDALRRGIGRALHPVATALRRFRPWTSLGTKVAVLGGDGSVLLVRHGYVDGWHLPGGAVDRFERVADAAAREVREEAGIALAAPPRLFAVYANFRRGLSDQVLLFVADRPPGAPRSDGREVVEAAYFPADAPPGGTTPATRRRLAEIRGEATVAPDW